MRGNRYTYSLAELWSVLSIPDIRFEYDSYDHRLASEEQAKRLKITHITDYINSYFIDDDIKQKFKTIKIGKLFNISYRQGRLYKIYIGHKRQKSFTLDNFGYEVKPIINPFQDRFDLIGRGLAVKQVNK